MPAFNPYVPYMQSYSPPDGFIVRWVYFGVVFPLVIIAILLLLVFSFIMGKKSATPKEPKNRYSAMENRISKDIPQPQRTSRNYDY